jgi:uracil-DNA glycosylase
MAEPLLDSRDRHTHNPSWLQSVVSGSTHTKNEDATTGDTEYDARLTLPAGWSGAAAFKSGVLLRVLDAVEAFLGKELQTYGDNRGIFPPKPHVFRALELVPLASVRVVILGQDPYIRPGQATGLAFSVPTGTPLPPSLRNILAKVAEGPIVPLSTAAAAAAAPPVLGDGDLTAWAKQGVLLLNTSLTVREGASNTHRKVWHRFTSALVAYIAQHAARPIVFLLWGRNAYNKRTHIDCIQHTHHLLCASHPSPMSCHRRMQGRPAFQECNPFVACNTVLREWGEPTIQW